MQSQGESGKAGDGLFCMEGAVFDPQGHGQFREKPIGAPREVQSGIHQGGEDFDQPSAAQRVPVFIPAAVFHMMPTFYVLQCLRNCRHALADPLPADVEERPAPLLGVDRHQVPQALHQVGGDGGLAPTRGLVPQRPQGLESAGESRSLGGLAVDRTKTAARDLCAQG